MKCAVELNRLLLNLVFLCDVYSGKVSQRKRKLQLSRDNLGEKKVLESAFCGLLESLKSKIQNFYSGGNHGAVLSISRFELLGGWNMCLHN